jgi:hypothetical protein
MPLPHVEILIEILGSTPWPFLGEISAELDTRCHVQYIQGYCCAMLNCRGYSLQVMRHIARQRGQNQHPRYLLAFCRIMIRPSQLVFADEVGKTTVGAAGAVAGVRSARASISPSSSSGARTSLSWRYTASRGSSTSTTRRAGTRPRTSSPRSSS